MANIIERLRESSKTKTIILLDYDTNTDVDNPKKPLSHASLIKAYVEGIYPYGDGKHSEQQTVITAKKSKMSKKKENNKQNEKRNNEQNRIKQYRTSIFGNNVISIKFQRRFYFGKQGRNMWCEHRKIACAIKRRKN